MNPHYSEADLLETYYTQPGQSMPVMMHLADCAECAARYERLDRKIRALASCDNHARPESFWVRQRNAIVSRVERGDRRAFPQPLFRFAAASALVLMVGATMTWPLVSRPAVIAAETVVEEAVPDDPWQSEELSDFQPLVEWESWIEEGGRS